MAPKEDPKAPAAAADKAADKKKKKKEEEEVSEEDAALIEKMQLLVTRCSDVEKGIRVNALTEMSREIREATSSMTSVPKPLKFLRPHYPTLKQIHTGGGDEEVQKMLADVLSVLAMTYAEARPSRPDDGARESLRYKLIGAGGKVGAWGHEYVRHLAAEVGEEYNARLAAADAAADRARETEAAKEEGGEAAEMETAEAEGAAPLLPAEELLPLVTGEMVPFFIASNAESEAIDLLMECGQADTPPRHLPDTFQTVLVASYVAEVSSYVAEPEDAQAVLQVAIAILRKLRRFPEAMRLALRLRDDDAISEIMTACDDPLVSKQMAYMLARQGVRPEIDGLAEELDRVMDGAHLPEHFHELARDLDVLEPKTPDDIYKSHLEKRPASAAAVDSARANLASTFVNAFVNLGFGADKLMLPEGNKWLYKNKEHGMTSAAASLGALLCWDVDGGLTQIDKFLYMSDTNIKAGALLAVGILNCGVRNECDPALALLNDYVEPGAETPQLKMGALLGLGLAYLGTRKAEVLEQLVPVVADLDTPLEVVAMASLSLGLTFAGSCHEDITQTIIAALMEREEASLATESLTRLLCLGVGLLYIGRQGEADLALELAKAVPGEAGAYCAITLETCAYAGTGNVLKVDADLNPLPVTVRVGTAVDVVGLAGRPKTITGFQTHTTPVLLAIGERAELATDEYLPLTSVLEGVVILKKNPEFEGQ
ncbi:hypothetical protein EMIHUDRAFT_469845 [Emiliania huxleyi CCMP1516]|uniref:26S proteasome non-ATPase regulatory subunit 2 homolog n=2 Tax=Emiliania huxleyi TaxID=2903 RepID=A0A0D3JCI2_EMIH1|nr:hypothetical protein EMIHUDRAFT_469845 [Emiliania huxleyi CCMP1516]EOD21217.1 hypothetical protein EMIHUDRAFT_469845 [Emiliania huxleyi CCMP1516]|eukprot:XP_005773646.1 hypothetical protein EMIHUDRAFT_469845 [Emiliania huxleyi CCMP1516]